MTPIEHLGRGAVETDLRDLPVLREESCEVVRYY